MNKDSNICYLLVDVVMYGKIMKLIKMYNIMFGFLFQTIQK